jgi:hypothetical protein
LGGFAPFARALHSVNLSPTFSAIRRSMSRRGDILSGKVPERIDRLTVAERQERYRAELEAQVGASDMTRGFRDMHYNPGAPSSFGELLARPASIVIAALLVFGLTFAVLLWRDGTFDRWLSSGAPASGPKKLNAGEMGIFDVEVVESPDPPWPDPYEARKPKPALAAPEEASAPAEPEAAEPAAE